jgi:hypothetical protein
LIAQDVSKQSATQQDDDKRRQHRKSQTVHLSYSFLSLKKSSPQNGTKSTNEFRF